MNNDPASFAPPPCPSLASLRAWLGGMDVYLFDQLVRGRLEPPMKLLDAGCGGGRNLPWLMRSGFEVFAADSSPQAVEHVRGLARGIAPDLPEANFRAEPAEAMTFEDASFDAVISCAVLHFARDEKHFRAMLAGMWRTLKPGGLFFARLASRSAGMEKLARPLGNGRYFLPDGSERFLADTETLAALGEAMGGELLDPIKTANVQGLRCMATWALRKRP